MVTQGAIEGDFPGWRVWRSDCGDWWATRAGRPLTDAQFEAGMEATVCGPTADLLHTELLRQRIAEDRHAEQVMAS